MSIRERRVWGKRPKHTEARDLETEVEQGSTVELAWQPVAATLEVLAGPDQGQLYLLDSHGVVIGRDPSCDVVLADRTISRRHAQVVASQGVFYLRDLDSPNGTYLDDRRIGRVSQLESHCRVRLGRHTSMDFTVVDAMGLDNIYRRFEDQARLKVQVEHGRQLSEQARLLEATVADLELFARAAAHDLASPLVGIGLNLEVMLADARDSLDDEQLGALEDAVDSVRVLSRRLSDLSSYARLREEVGAVETVDLDRALEDVLAGLAPKIEEGGVTVEAGALPMVKGNGALLELLLHNVLDNAVKFRSQDDPMVRIRATERGERWEITVEDNGIGIPVDKRAEAFLPFTRLHPVERSGGSGMGLAIARRIVRMHRGKIGVMSGYERGTTVYILLPGTESRTTLTFDPDWGSLHSGDTD